MDRWGQVRGWGGGLACLSKGRNGGLRVGADWWDGSGARVIGSRRMRSDWWG